MIVREGAPPYLMTSRGGSELAFDDEKKMYNVINNGDSYL